MFIILFELASIFHHACLIIVVNIFLLKIREWDISTRVELFTKISRAKISFSKTAKS